MRLPVYLLAAGMLALAACNGGGEAGDSTPSASPTASPVPTSAPGVVPGPGVTDDEIVLGMTSDVNGTGGTPYAAISAGIKAYFAKVNAEDGGVCGRNLAILIRDDKYNPDEALAQTKALVEQDKVLSVISALGTQAHLAVANYLNDPNTDAQLEDGVPDLFVSSGYSGFGDVTRWPWTVGFIPDYQTDGKILTGYINEKLAGKKVGVLFQSDEFGNDYGFAVRNFLADPALLVSEQPHDPGATDIGPYMTNFIEAGAEVVVLATPPEVTARAIANAHGGGYNPTFLLSYVNSPTQLATLIGGGTEAEQLAAGIKELTGVVSTSYLMSAIQDDSEPEIVEHERIMQTYDGPLVSTLSIYAQSLAETVVETLSRSCHNLTRKGLNDAARTVQGFEPSLFLPGIEVTLSPQDHRSVQTMQLVQYHEDGTLRPIGDPVTLQ